MFELRLFVFPLFRDTMWQTIYYLRHNTLFEDSTFEEINPYILFVSYMRRSGKILI